MNRQFIFFIAILFIFVACDPNIVFDDFRNTGVNNWDKDSIVSFQVEIADSTSDYDILLSTRNLENYPYSNLWLFVDIIAPNSSSVRDTVEYELAQANGKWLGKGTGGVYVNQFTFRSMVFFPFTGKYEVRIQHGMRDPKLEGLRDIGLTIRKK